MNKILFCCLLLLAQVGFAQTSVNTTTTGQTSPAFKLPVLDKSPMDMSYYPANYPVLRIQDKANEPLVARVIYSRPQKEGRTIFGGLVEYGQVWRLGANEATELELYRDVKVKDKKLPKGRYTLYAIPTETQWTIIFNKDTDIWGAFKYDQKKDVLRVDVPVQKSPTVVEPFTLSFNKSTNGADMIMAWDEAMVTVPFSFK
ncbi:DUF2911 domain-containing protein [Flavisolibacter nicotianae]|uniref:DUF2911 domain-containing protein n=1 Tax=Flavisolibacter nicotianae TaxID=2364882 RepID=UPI000EB14EA2|nr:DUF2911 domain-containing protein [Flavisolibacter nicotianae]